MADILREMSEDEVDELMELYKNKYGVENFHYLLMYNQRKWDEQLKNKNVDKTDRKWRGFIKTFYTHRNGDFRKTGTYISLHFDTIQSVSLHTWEPKLNDLLECLRQTNLINWEEGPLFTNVNLFLCDIIKEVGHSKGIKLQRARTCVGHLLKHEDALDLNPGLPPHNYILEPLQIEDAELVHSLWTNRTEGSVEYIRGLIEINQTLGIRTKDGNNLMAWIFQNDFSGVGILQVLPEVQRQGLGKILAENLSRSIAEVEEVDITAWIVVDNIRSGNLLNKVGFEQLEINEWIHFDKKN